jgi:hypothetical protein
VAVAVAVHTLVPAVVQVELTKKETIQLLLARRSQLKLALEEEALTGARVFMEQMVGSQNLDRSPFLVAVEAHLGTGLIQTEQVAPTVRL